MDTPKIRSAEEVLAGKSSICTASSVEHDGHRQYGLVQISIPLTRVTPKDARRIANALELAARQAETEV